MSTPEPDASLSQESLERAALDVEALREVLRRVSRAQDAPDTARIALERFWREHGDALSSVATALGNQLRTQVLSDLYQWRAQLSALQSTRR